MRRQITISKTAVFLFGTICLGLSLFSGQASAANVDVGVNIALPPLFRIAAPPQVVVVPGTYVYAVPDINVDIFFFRGAWYRPHKDHWFKASSYNGPWRFVEPRRMPREVLVVPHHDHQWTPPGHQRIPYGQMKKNWKKWERDRRWERDVAWREGWEHDDRRGHGPDNRQGRPNGKDWHENKGPQGPDNRGRDGRDDRPRDFDPRGNGPDRGHDQHRGR